MDAELVYELLGLFVIGVSAGFTFVVIRWFVNLFWG